MGDNRKTTKHNIEILGELGFSQYRNTTVFQKGQRFILSPAAAQNSNSGYWFDTCKVNLDRLKPDKNPLLLVRMVPDLFVVKSLCSLSSVLDEKLMKTKPHSGEVWENLVVMQSAKVGEQVSIASKKDRTRKVETVLLNRQQAIQKANDYFSK